MTNDKKITILVKKVIYQNPGNDWAVISAMWEDKDITACGVMAQVAPHESLEVTGNWRKHERYGMQFQIVTAYKSTSYTRDGIFRYLSSGNFSGIGQATARKIVDAFGTDTVKILTAEPHKLFKVKGVPRKAIYNLIAKWKDAREQAETLTALSDHQIPLYLAARIYQEYGEKSLSVVRRDPYQLPFTIQGLGFLTADKIGQAMGIEPYSQLRIRGAINYFLQINEDRGHCFLTSDQLLVLLEKNLKLTRQDLEASFVAALHQGEKENYLISEKINSTQSAHYRYPIYTTEVSIANKIKEMLTPVPIPGEARTNGENLVNSYRNLSPEQRDTARNLFQHRLTVVTGGAGTGKTTTVRLIIELADRLRLKYSLCAPTGRAACRLKELTGKKATTIHRLLEWQPQIGGFSKNSVAPLADDLVVVDEASMLDITLAQAILTSLNPQAKLLLVGDANQLPPIGAGNFLRDILKVSSLPAVELTKVFRQEHTSQIVRNAHLIIHGKSTGLVGGRDFIFVEEQDENKIIHQIKKWLQLYPDAQILSPIYKGLSGIDWLNIEIKSWLTGTSRGDKLQLEDKVIQIVNNYTLDVYNGDIGFVAEVNEKKEVVVDFRNSDKRVIYKPQHQRELRLAHAISIHKSQGSEFPTVIMPVVKQHYQMLNKNLIYTAITRAKRKMIVIGSAAMFKAGVQKNYDYYRQTRLYNRIIAEEQTVHTMEKHRNS